jgi:hypothetical protein
MGANTRQYQYHRCVFQESLQVEAGQCVHHADVVQETVHHFFKSEFFSKDRSNQIHNFT